MNFAIGLLIAVGCILGGYAALGGHLEVLMQPFYILLVRACWRVQTLTILSCHNGLCTLKCAVGACL